ncbi:nitrogen fixation protein NifM [Sedimenticola sp.]|uniref:nitrogen fixation protein NifM n=1 Tax=Sedimenticola sp. TaxID=1940285 RepID=UPI003D0CA108
MGSSERHPAIDPGFGYHLLRQALRLFGKNLAQLQPAEYRQVQEQATRSFELESRVLAADEAEGVMIPVQQLDASLNQLVSRYESREAFLQDLAVNGLDEAGLRLALQRELLFDAVMQRVTADCPGVSDIDVGLFYEMHRERFEAPETRVARHILITVNPEYAENTRHAAYARVEQLVEKLAGRVNRFADFAKRYSECPTAMQGGALGDVKPGQLYAELDAMLFSLPAGEISPIVESEMGFHLLLCDKIKPGKRIPLSRAAGKIRVLLQQRHQRNCQQAWLDSLSSQNSRQAV